MSPLAEPGSGVERVLSVDPGSRLLGFAVLDKLPSRKVQLLDQGTLKLWTPDLKDQDLEATVPLRLQKIYESLVAIIDHYRPQALVVEKVFFAKNAVSALKLGQARGVVLLSGAMHGLKVFEYSPNEVKNTVTGQGHADKEQVAKMVQMILGPQNFETFDASDAVALGLAHLMGSGAPKSVKTGRGSSLRSVAENYSKKR